MIKLTPVHDSSAPTTIAFTDFPGIGVRVGRWVTDWFPSCGCDACGEMPEEEFERFTEFLSNVVAGRFRESLCLEPAGDGWSSMELWAPGDPGGGPVHLTPIEYRLLAELSAGRVLTYQHLLDRVWGARDESGVRPMRTVMNKPRRKLGEDSESPTYIFTEPPSGTGCPGVGWRKRRREPMNLGQSR